MVSPENKRRSRAAGTYLAGRILRISGKPLIPSAAIIREGGASRQDGLGFKFDYDDITFIAFLRAEFS